MLKRNTNLHKLLVNSPDMARAFNGVGGYIRFKSKLDPRLRELAILQVGWMEKSEYEFTHHVKIGKEFGVTDDDIAAPDGRDRGQALEARAAGEGDPARRPRDGARARDVGCDASPRSRRSSPTSTMVDLVLTIAFYCAVVRVLATMKMDNEPYYKEVLKQYPILEWNEMRLKDRVAIVVGAGQSPGEGIGNGRATALTFAREGAKVLCVSIINSTSAQETVDLIAAKDGTAAAFKADVTKNADLKAMVADAHTPLGPHRHPA